jgi:hypothetical protein
MGRQPLVVEKYRPDQMDQARSHRDRLTAVGAIAYITRADDGTLLVRATEVAEDVEQSPWH